ncbi:MAG: YceI family protein [Pseudomonadales bacterium]|nr:YceI family protein [Pseudomonadales bacterium]
MTSTSPNTRLLMKSFFAAIVLASSATALAADYKIDETHSFVQFRTQHLGYSWLYGRFSVIGGTLVYDAEKPANNSVNIDVDVDSINTNHDLRDEHLENKYLHTDKFPKANFRSTAYKGDATSGELTGELTLNNVKKTVTIPVKKIGEGADPWGGYRVGFEGTLRIDTRDYGYDYQLGEHSFVVELQLGVEGVRVQTSPSKS